VNDVARLEDPAVSHLQMDGYKLSPIDPVSKERAALGSMPVISCLFSHPTTSGYIAFSDNICRQIAIRALYITIISFF
jgi:hypothetical protein